MARREHEQLGPDWPRRLSRGTCALGLVWLVIGGVIVVVHLRTGEPADLDRGWALMILGAAPSGLGVLLLRRVHHRRRVDGAERAGRAG